MLQVVFALTALTLVASAILYAHHNVEKERKEIKPHVHRWRAITEWARQCSDRKCSEIEVEDGAPDGMPEYLRLMTTRLAKEDPIREALIYRDHDPRMSLIDGKTCDSCGRIYPAVFAWCPYCNDAPEPSH